MSRRAVRGLALLCGEGRREADLAFAGNTRGDELHIIVFEQDRLGLRGLVEDLLRAGAGGRRDGDLHDLLGPGIDERRGQQRDRG